jgi:hypothetical protein
MSNEIVKSTQAVQQFNFFNPEHFATMQRACTLFASSELVPDMYKISDKNPKEKAIANCMIALEMAQRIGASPLMVMQNLFIVYGRPGWSSKFLIASVNTCGRFEALDFKITSLGIIKDIEYVEYRWDSAAKKKLPHVSKFAKDVENLECVAFTKEIKSGKILESPPVSIKIAIQEGWYQKDGSKWPNMTKLMLTYRAAAWWTNTHAPELSMGMKTSDEIEDIIPYEDVTEKVKTDIQANANKTEIAIETTTETAPSETAITEPAANGQAELTGPGF